MQTSNSIGLGIGINRTNVTGGLTFALDSSKLNNEIKSNTSMGTLSSHFTLGLEADHPAPNHIKAVSILKAFKDNFWTVHQRESLGIQKKRANLERALEGYVEYKKARISPGMYL